MRISPKQKKRKKSIKPLVRNKSLCIFALGFINISYKTNQDILIQDLKITNNEQKNVSTIEKKEKK